MDADIFQTRARVLNSLHYGRLGDKARGRAVQGATKGFRFTVTQDPYSIRRTFCIPTSPPRKTISL